MRLAPLPLMLALAFPVALSAQEGAAAVDPAFQSPPAVQSAAEPTAAAEPATSEAATTDAQQAAAPASDQHAVRRELINLLNDHPPEVGRVLAADPELFNNRAYVERYPELAAFLAAHPEVGRNPHFFAPRFQPEVPPRSGLAQMFEAVAVFGSFLVAALALGWLVRTWVEQRRWNRLSKIQTEVHTKLLDRFGTSEELLAYMKTPAGARFLESAPIPLHPDRPVRRDTPLPRSLWSLQAGVVLAAGAIGMMLVSLRFDDEAGAGVFALGGIGLCLGLGFIASAVIALVLSRRLGLWTPGDSEPPAGPRTEDAGYVG